MCCLVNHSLSIVSYLSRYISNLWKSRPGFEYEAIKARLFTIYVLSCASVFILHSSHMQSSVLNSMVGSVPSYGLNYYSKGSAYFSTVPGKCDFKIVCFHSNYEKTHVWPYITFLTFSIVCKNQAAIYATSPCHLERDIEDMVQGHYHPFPLSTLPLEMWEWEPGQVRDLEGLMFWLLQVPFRCSQMPLKIV